MLYNPDWSKHEVKADPFSLKTLIAWLEKQPADKEYDYICNGECLLAQYFAQHGFSRVNVASHWFDHSGGRTDLPRHFGDIACGVVDPVFDMKHTFGAALGRARCFAHD